MGSNDVESAFPCPKSLDTDINLPDGKVAKIVGVPFETGMSLRDYFAAKALQGFCVNMADQRFKDIRDGIQAGGHEARVAYLLADAMLSARRHDSTGGGK